MLITTTIKLNGWWFLWAWLTL